MGLVFSFFLIVTHSLFAPLILCVVQYTRGSRGVLPYIQGEKKKNIIKLNLKFMTFFIISPQIYCLFQIPMFVPHPPSLVSPPVLLRQHWVHPPRTPWLWLLLPSHYTPDWNCLRGDSLPCLKSHLKSSSLFPMFKCRVGVSHHCHPDSDSTASIVFFCSLGPHWTLAGCRHPRLRPSNLSSHPLDYCLFTSFSA